MDIQVSESHTAASRTASEGYSFSNEQNQVESLYHVTPSMFAIINKTTGSSDSIISAMSLPPSTTNSTSTEAMFAMLHGYEKAPSMSSFKKKHTSDSLQETEENAKSQNDKRKDWDSQIQAIMEQFLSQQKPTPHQLHQFARLVAEFSETASTYARIIISERCLPREQQSIKPVSGMGIASGDKYIVQNILFKFAQDAQLMPGYYMYGGTFRNDAAAMKSMALEMVALDTVHATQVQSFRFPLVCMIDYKGTRVLAFSLLPISNKTIVYGSDDGGRNIYAKDDHTNKLVQAAGEALHWGPHKVGKNQQKIYGPGDMEVHRVVNETSKLAGQETAENKNVTHNCRQYLVDLARCNPPEAPLQYIQSLMFDASDDDKRGSKKDRKAQRKKSTSGSPENESEVSNATSYISTDSSASLLENFVSIQESKIDMYWKNVSERGIFYRHLRPEFVLQYNKPLVADAFSAWDKFDPDCDQHKQDIVDATMHLHQKVIPQTATILLKKFQEVVLKNKSSAGRTDGRAEGFGYGDVHREMEKRSLNFPTVALLHENGVNVRHIGLIYKHLPSKKADGVKQFRRFLLEIAIARSMKNYLRSQMRSKMDIVSIPADSPFCELVAHTLNCCLIACGHGESALRAMLLAGHTQQSSTETNVEDGFQLDALQNDYVNGVRFLILKQYPGFPPSKLNAKKFAKLDVKHIVCYLVRVAGVTLDPRAVQSFFKKPAAFVFRSTDVIHLNPIVRHSYFNMLLTALSRFHSAASVEKDPDASKLLLKDALSFSRVAAFRLHSCPIINFYIANIHAKLAMAPKMTLAKRQKHFTLAYRHFDASSDSILTKHPWNVALTNKAVCMYDHSRCLKQHGKKKQAKQMKLEAVKLLKKANEIVPDPSRHFVACLFSNMYIRDTSPLES